MAFSLELTAAQQDLVRRTHAFAEQEIRPVAERYDREEEFPWPVLERAADEGFYNALFYRDLIADPTGLSLPLFMEELFWGCASPASSRSSAAARRTPPSSASTAAESPLTSCSAGTTSSSTGWRRRAT